MTRAWAASIAGIQDAIKAAIDAERALRAGSLPTPLHAADFEVVGAVNRDNRTLLPTGMRIFPPANSSIDAEVSNGFEGILAFPVIVTVKSLGESDVLDLLREATGLLIDSVATDPTLGGLTGGTASPGLVLGPIDTDGGEATQEIQVRLHVRNAA